MENPTEIEKRLQLFKQLFDVFEQHKIPLEGREATAIARSATSEFGINQKVDNLSDLKLETLTEYEFNRIVRRARTAIKRVLELRQKFAPIMKDETQPDGTVKRVPTGERAGPFYKNRKMRRGIKKRIIKTPRAAQRSSFASVMLEEQKAKRLIPI